MARFPSIALRHLRCPFCHRPLEQDPAVLRCCEGHCFDVARQGYVNFLAAGRRAARGDTATMVAARARFLLSGHYAPLAHHLATIAEEALGEGRDRLIVDVGAGTGYYAAHILERCAGAAGIAVDVSKFAARRAARAHPRLGAVVATAEALPVADGAVDLSVVAFAPRAAPELERVIAPHGAVLIAMPTPRHLAEIVEPLGLLRVDEHKRARLHARLVAAFVPALESTFEHRLRLSRAEVLLLASMGPSAFHVSASELQRRIERLPTVIEVSASLQVALFRRREPGRACLDGLAPGQ